MNLNTPTQPNFGGASTIKSGELFETSGSRAKAILTLDSMEEVNLISDIIFDTLPISDNTRKKIKNGYSGYKATPTTNSQGGSAPSFSTQKDADDYAKANGGKVETRTVPGGKVYIVK